MKVQLILEALKKTGRTTEILLNIFIGGYDYKKLKRKVLYPTLPEPSRIEDNTQLFKKRKNSFYSLLSQLKQQGFVQKEQKKGKIYWKITSLGEKNLEKLKNVFHFPKLNCKREKDNGLNIVIFDVPEKQKSKRNWLRETLLSLGFTILQKSVWIGKNKLPEEFLKSLAELNLIEFIHILKVAKTGTIKRLNY